MGICWMQHAVGIGYYFRLNVLRSSNYQGNLVLYPTHNASVEKATLWQMRYYKDYWEPMDCFHRGRKFGQIHHPGIINEAFAILYPSYIRALCSRIHEDGG